jgi:hypothetical protein
VPVSALSPHGTDPTRSDWEDGICGPRVRVSCCDIGLGARWPEWVVMSSECVVLLSRDSM